VTVPDTSAVAAAVADAHRREWAFVLAATVRVTRDLDRAEECVQEAFAAALTDWHRSGIPGRPGAWLTTTARRRALNVVRHQGGRGPLPSRCSWRRRPSPARSRRSTTRAHRSPDDRLRLSVTCCHPALDRPAQVALTLRLLCGLSTAEVARAFLVSEATMAARITRAKKKIAVARIPYRVPPAAELPERIDAVLSVVHLLFTTGHTVRPVTSSCAATSVERSLELCRMLRRLLPREPAVAGCWRCCCSPTPAGRPAPRRTGGCCCSRSRTVRSGTAPRSRRA
jgi:RNA polymerase sigma-70 factor (ECF subfamily)